MVSFLGMAKNNNMKTKEQILKDSMSKPYCGKTYFDFLDDVELHLIYTAMEEYRKQGRYYTPSEINNIESQAYDAGFAYASMQTGWS